MSARRGAGQGMLLCEAERQMCIRTGTRSQHGRLCGDPVLLAPPRWARFTQPRSAELAALVSPAGTTALRLGVFHPTAVSRAGSVGEPRWDHILSILLFWR